MRRLAITALSAVLLVAAKLAGNNAGFEIWVVNPIPGGWELFEVR